MKLVHHLLRYVLEIYPRMLQFLFDTPVSTYTYMFISPACLGIPLESHAQPISLQGIPISSHLSFTAYGMHMLLSHQYCLFNNDVLTYDE